MPASVPTNNNVLGRADTHATNQFANFAMIANRLINAAGPTEREPAGPVSKSGGRGGKEDRNPPMCEASMETLEAARKFAKALEIMDAQFADRFSLRKKVSESCPLCDMCTEQDLLSQLMVMWHSQLLTSSLEGAALQMSVLLHESVDDAGVVFPSEVYNHYKFCCNDQQIFLKGQLQQIDLMIERLQHMVVIVTDENGVKMHGSNPVNANLYMSFMKMRLSLQEQMDRNATSTHGHLPVRIHAGASGGNTG